MKKLIKIILPSILLNLSYFALAFDNKKLINQTVKLKSSPSLSVYGNTTEKIGIGTLIDKKQGLFLITKSLANYLSICRYEIEFNNGMKADAVLKYFDPWLNIAILKVNPNDIPKNYSEANFVKTLPNDNSILVASMQNKNISISNGKIVDKNCISGDFLPQQSYQTKIENKGYFESAPIFDEKGNLLSIVLEDSQGVIYILDPNYILELISSKDFNSPKKRKGIGAICELYSLTDAVKYRNFPKEFLEKYIKEFPDYKTNILIVKSIIKGTPAENQLEVGDIIISVNGISTGASLQKFDHLTDSSENRSIKIQIIRDGQTKNLVIDTYNMENTKIKNFIEFSSTIFFESDETYSAMTGMPIGELTFYRSQNSNAFSEVFSAYENDNSRLFLVKEIEFDNSPTKNLHDLEIKIPDLIKKSDFSLNYRCIMPLFIPLSEVYEGMAFNEKVVSLISLSEHEKDCYSYSFDSESNSWKKRSIK